MSREVDVPRLLTALGIDYDVRGAELWAPCPHPQHKKETRPSWSIKNRPFDSQHGVFNCFGCQWSGSAPKLVSVIHNLSLEEARQWITDQRLWLDGELPITVEIKLMMNRQLGCRIPPGVTFDKEWPSVFKSYAKKRGITDQQIVRWGLGFAIDGALGSRIVFPVRDQGKTLRSFHARTILPSSDRRFKNASEEDGFTDGYFFGMEHWDLSCKTVVLTEGAIDALACERAGVTNVAAVGGSQLHPLHSLHLTRFQRVICATDRDRAGNSLGAYLYQTLGSNVVTRLDVPKGQDTASITQEMLTTLLKRCT